MGESRKRRQNHGIRKLCDCSRKQWPKCSHPWHFNYKPKGGPAYRFSLDAELGYHIEGKTEAAKLAEDIRAGIRNNTFRRRSEGPAPANSPPPDSITIAKVIETYEERCSKPVSANDRGCLRQFAACAIDGRPLGETPLASLTADTLDVFFTRLNGRAASTRNKYVQAITALCRWATKKGYLARNPIAETESLKRQKHAKRNRRLAPDVLNDEGKMEREGEERRLLAVAGPHLQRLIVAALETGMRRGELLNLQWRDVQLERKEIAVRAETTKTRTGRILPVSSRLAAILEMAHTAMLTFLQNGPAKDRTEDETAALLARCYVFGDEAGQQVGNVKRAWETAVLKAHGYSPEWTAGNALAPTSRAAIDAIDLHFHDLRHEAGSRLLEAGWPLHHVQHMLGHANVSQTSTYLNATKVGLHESMRRFDNVRSEREGSGSETEHIADQVTKVGHATTVVN